MASHFIITNKGKAVRCVTGKRAEKSKREIESMPGYHMQEYAKENCPFCTPGAKMEDAEKTHKHGVCSVCPETRQGQFKLQIKDGVLIRTCKDCGTKFDLDKMEICKGA